jgi:hypothetical protein
MSDDASLGGTYNPSLFSSTMEQGSLSAELKMRTSSLDSDKGTQTGRLYSSFNAPAANESFLAFCTEVLQYNHEDEDDKMAKVARDAALATAQSAYANVPNRWMSPRVATDGGGGVRLTWKFADKELRAIFPADVARMQYLYKEKGEEHSMIPNFTWATLCSQLEWLFSNK